MTSYLRLRSALVVAAIGHGLIALALRTMPPPARPTVRATRQEVTVEVDTPATPPLDPSESAVPPVRTATTRSSITRATEASGSRGSEVVTSADANVQRAEPSWSFDPMLHPPTDLGLGSRWKGALGAGPPTDGVPARPQNQARESARAMERSIRAELAASDVERGLGRAGPLVSAAHRAASSAGAPETGATTLEVECDAAGAVTSARAEDKAWNEVATALVDEMKGKALRVPRGARGLRARLRVVAERALPSGARGRTSLGALPDDVPGSSRACDGQGITRRCVNGMPVGITSASHDTSDIGAKPSRVVHVQLVGEVEI